MINNTFIYLNFIYDFCDFLNSDSHLNSHRLGMSMRNVRDISKIRLKNMLDQSQQNRGYKRPNSILNI